MGLPLISGRFLRHKMPMNRIGKAFIGLTASLLATNAAQAMPDDVSELRQIIAQDFGGDVNAYIQEEYKDFRQMGCKGRVDLLQALLDDGLQLDELSHRTHMGPIRCALMKSEAAAFALVLTPDRLSAWEASMFDDANVMSPLQFAIYENEYGIVRAMLENGVHQHLNDDDYAVLTREEQLLLAANYAMDAGKENAIRAFRDTGWGDFLTASQDDQNIRYIRARAGKTGGGGGLLRTIAGGVAGAYLGGTTGAALGILGGGTSGKDDDVKIDPSKPLPLPTRRASLGVLLGMDDPAAKGLKVAQVADGGPAEAAGLSAGDVIMSIGGVPVASRGSLYVATEKVAEAEQFEVEYLRAGKMQLATFGLPQPKSESGPTRTTVAGTAQAPSEDTTLAELERLADLRDRGVLSQEEFEEMKARILAGS